MVGLNLAPLIYAVVLTYNRPAELAHCLECITRSDYPNLKVLVVDNGSLPGSLRSVWQAFPGVQVHTVPSNLGWTGGNNAGVRLALEGGAQAVLLLNDDLYVQEATLSHMAKAAGLWGSQPASPISASRVAAVGCKVLVYEHPRLVWAAGMCFWRGRQLPEDDGRFDQPGEIDYAVGCCMLVTRDAFQVIGLFDPAFFVYYDDMDWCWRARQAGYRVVYAPEAVSFHQLGISMGASSSPKYHYMFTRNRLLFEERYGQLPESGFKRWKRIYQAWAYEVYLLKQIPTNFPRRMAAVTWGVFDYLRGRFGPPPAALS